MKTCDVCGAVINDGVDICPICGAKVSAAVVPSMTDAADTADNKSPAPPSGGNACPSCGAMVAEGKKFCSDCGAKIPEKKAEIAGNSGICPKCGAVVAKGNNFCSNCGARMIEETPKFRFCPSCGANVEGKKFCSDCGMQLYGKAQTVSPSTAHAAARPRMAAGTIKQYLPTIGVMLTLIVTFVFMFLPFLSVKASLLGSSDKIKHWGVTGIAVLFTGESDLITQGGANEIVMRLVGAGYILLILAVVWYILFAISSILKYDKKSLDNQILFNAILTGISLFLTVLCAVAKYQINSDIDVEKNQLQAVLGSALDVKLSWFLGAVGLFVCEAVMLIYSIAVRATYGSGHDRPSIMPNLLGKKVRAVLILLDVIAIIACTVIPVVMGCSVGAANRPDKSNGIEDSGSFTVKCNESVTEMGITMYYGVAYFDYTPVSNGSVSAEITSPDPETSMLAMAAVGIGEYDDVLTTYRSEGNYGVIGEYVDGSSTTYTVVRDTKYSIVFVAISFTKNEKINVSYEFDDGGTRDVNSSSSGGATRATAEAIYLGANVSTGSMRSGESKWYKYTPGSSATYTIASSDYTGDPDIKIYASISSNYSMKEDYASGGFALDVDFTAGNTYYIEISASSNATRCTFSIVRQSITAADGSTREKAIELTLGSPISTGNLSYNTYKWYKFTPPVSDLYRFYTTTYTGDPDLKVYTSLTADWTSFEDSNAGGFDVTRTLYPSLTYYIGIYASSSSSSCTFVITSPTVTNNGATRTTAIEIESNSYIATDNIAGGESKWYKFTPSISGIYRIYTVYNSPYATPHISVYSALSSFALYSDTTYDPFDLSVTLGAGATYYIEIFTDGYTSFNCTFIVSKV